MEVCFGHIVQSGVFVGDAWIHAFLIHISLLGIYFTVITHESKLG